jgi:hypothetical protein
MVNSTIFNSYLYKKNFKINLFIIYRDFMQKERARFKELLANAHNELNNTKSLIEKENEIKTKHDLSFQEILEEKSKLLTT